MKRLKGVYKIATTVITASAIAYFLLLSFPQALFAYSAEHGKFRVHAREPLTPEIDKVLETAETRLRTSPIYDDAVRRDIYLTNGFGMYAFLSHKAYKSFANSVPFIDNVFINKTDIGADRVYVNRPESNMRSLSGVIAHETAHLFIRKRYGTISATLMPTWKNEGYCEYIAGDWTLTTEEGIRRWKENPSDDSRYRYMKYYLMVKQLLDNEKISVDELFTGDFDEKQVAERTFAALQ